MGVAAPAIECAAGLPPDDSHHARSDRSGSIPSVSKQNLRRMAKASEVLRVRLVRERYTNQKVD